MKKTHFRLNLLIDMALLVILTGNSLTAQLPARLQGQTF